MPRPGLNSLDDAVAAIAGDAKTKDGYQPGPSNGQKLVVGGSPANNSNGLLVDTAIFVTLYQGKQYHLIFVTTPEQEDAVVTGAKGVFDSWQLS